MTKKILFSILSALIWAQNVTAQMYQVAQAPKHEVRAVWLTTIGGIDWPAHYANAASPSSIERQKREFIAILDDLQKTNINTILLQTRVRGTTIYPSAIETWDGCLSGKPGVSPGYDALQFAIDECHRRGMELHAWVVTIPVGKWNAIGCKSLRKRYPGLIRQIQGEGYMNPEMPQTGDYIARICKEITDKYDVDGIHLDYIRYPETWKIKVSKSKGREYITSIVRKIHRAVKQNKPWIKLSCSPIGKYDDLTRYRSGGWNANSTVCQDAQGWLRDGLMDALFPMMYFRGNNFYPFAIDWKEQSYGRMIVPGLGIYFLDRKQKDWPLTDISREMYFIRSIGEGHCYFRSKFFTDDTKGIYSFARNQFDQYPALIPAMTWEKADLPAAPSHLNIIQGKSHDEISWENIDRGNEKYLYHYYNVYASDSYPVDVSDARNLIVVRTRSNKVIVPTRQHPDWHYALTAIDRYGNESKPALDPRDSSSDEMQILAYQQKGYLKCDGRTLLLPKAPSIIDIEYLVVKSLQGQVLYTLPYSEEVNVSKIPDGVYKLYSLNKKKVAHRMGFFQIYRK